MEEVTCKDYDHHVVFYINSGKQRDIKRQMQNNIQIHASYFENDSTQTQTADQQATEETQQQKTTNEDEARKEPGYTLNNQTGHRPSISQPYISHLSPSADRKQRTLRKTWTDSNEDNRENSDLPLSKQTTWTQTCRQKNRTGSRHTTMNKQTKASIEERYHAHATRQE